MEFRVPATSANLGPGFDSLGLALKLYNRFSLKPSKITSIQIHGEGSKNPKLRVDNVFVRIFNEQLKKLTGSAIPFKFVFDNAIPISRGLGSSSAVIIGAISAAFKVAQVPFDKQKIVNLALRYESHPDNITPACMGGFNVCMLASRDKEVRFINQSLPDSISAVVVIPNQSTSTHLSRQSLPKRYFQKDAVFNLSHASLLSSAFITGRFDLLREASQDRLHQFYRMKQIPLLFEVQRTALQNGALMSTLSGSGSSFFSLCYQDDKKRLFDALSQKFSKLKVLSLEFDNDGVLFENESLEYFGDEFKF
ncbi:homoserine kinase [Helicobacter winghamensis]|uniref:Homoserine kinase n=1 Tax=Helicobacter winghamensis TaxID=157268 RepID=A0A2N3PLP3_9HELI|nr:homoserine kinase [Helicobacter winghamensis]EEO26378.1 homoserine kinase [Helicobacter winghamensis ATCC BAA-430]PKT75177.1 homoserine kinase [Helicobacter winghamensis]PKT75252.1 homoserine kinase [Helicobacter winghamensis]PKT75300.1 homoserine kinase [Helicobacter winghamensis]PKT82748.1 homoserine kinase [Helicobacter winghamensis]